VDKSADNAYSAPHSQPDATLNGESPAPGSECGAPNYIKIILLNLLTIPYYFFIAISYFISLRFVGSLTQNIHF